MPRSDGHERTRKILIMAAILWIAAIAALAVGMRTRVKPVLIVGLVGAVIALGVTQVWLRGRPPGRE